MSQWHRENPELAGTDADPWMMHESYRDAVEEVRRMSPDYRACRECGAETPTWLSACQLCGAER